MQIIPAKTPGFVKTLFPNFIWNINTANKELYLTFDDGPTPEITDWVLQTLKSYEAKATFFCIGKNIKENPEVFWEILKNEHSVGNHTYWHSKGWKTKSNAYITEIDFTNELIETYINKYEKKILKSKSEISNPKIFRPPYGKFKTKQAKQLQKQGYKIVMWDVLSYDWDKSVSEEASFNNVISASKEGSIIVFHDSVKASRNLRYVLPKVLDYYSERGFQFKALY